MNPVPDRLRRQAEQNQLASDYVTAKLLFDAAAEVERLESRVPNPDDLRVLLDECEHSDLWSVRAAVDSVRATMEEA